MIRFPDIFRINGFGRTCLSSTDSQEVIRGFLQGQPAAVVKAFDAQFVDGAFQSTLFDGSATPRETEPPYKYIAPLSKMVELLGAEAPSTVLEPMLIWQPAKFIFINPRIFTEYFWSAIRRKRGSPMGW